MRHVIILMLLIVTTMVFGQLIGRVESPASNPRVACADCGQGSLQPSKNRQPQRLLSMESSSRASIPNEATARVFFTENGSPVRLVAVDNLSESHLEISYETVFDSLGQKVSVNNRRVISVFDKRMPSPTSPDIRLTKPDQVDALAANSRSLVAVPQQASNDGRSLNSHGHLIDGNSAHIVNVPLHVEQQNQPPAATHTTRSDLSSMANNDDIETVSEQNAQHEPSSMNNRKPSYKTLALYGVPAAVAVAAIARNNSADREPQRGDPVDQHAKVRATKSQAYQKVLRAHKPLSNSVGSASSRAFSWSASSVANDDTDTEQIEDKIDDIEDELSDLSDTVTDLGTTVGGVQSDVSTLEGQVSTLQTQLGSNDVDALAAQIETLESKTFAGIAAAASLVTPIPSEPGKTILNVGSGYYEGQTAIGVSLSRRMTNVNGYLYSGVASGVSEIESPLIRVGVGFEF